jgi:hypothetical protein
MPVETVRLRAVHVVAFLLVVGCIGVFMFFIDRRTRFGTWGFEDVPRERRGAIGPTTGPTGRLGPWLAPGPGR